MNRFHTIILSLVMLLGCSLAPADAEVSGDQAIAETEAGLAAADRLLDHGELWFGTSVEAELTAPEPRHAWSFELSAPATLTLATRGTATGPDVDTVLYLYRAGAKTYLARSDDHEGTVFSAISRKLGAGSYRIEVKGRTRRDTGPFAVSSECSDGCPVPIQSKECVFGQSVAAIAGYLRVSTILTLSAVEQLPNENARAQLLESTVHTPAAFIDTVEQVFASVDEGLVRWMKIWDDAGGREYVAYEYRISGSSFGAIFDAGSGQLVARIDDSQIAQCIVPARTCLFGSRPSALLTDPRFEVLARSTVTEQSVSSLSKLERAQLLAAARVAYPDAENVAKALASVDAQQVNRLVLEERSSARVVTIYEYGAGGNSYGGAFLEDGRAMRARIEDGAFTSCTLYDQD